MNKLPQNSTSWFSRHPILTAILIVFGFIFLINIIHAPSNPSQDDSLPIPTYPTRSPTTTPKITVTPTYRPPVYRTPTPVPAPINTPPPTPIPTPLVVKSWHMVTQFSGYENKNTDQFTTIGVQWRVRWTAIATDSYCLENGCSFSVSVYDPQKGYQQDYFLRSDIAGTRNDVNNFYSAGTYYLKVGGFKTDSWTITVEDYY